MTLRSKLMTVLVLAVVIIASIAGGLFASSYMAKVSGESMLQSYHNGDVVYGEKNPASFNHGDVIVFKDDDNWSGNDNEDLIKRVIAVPGDNVSIDNMGKIRVNGVLADNDSGYTNGCTATLDKPMSFKIPKDSLFVRGDNINNSRDSRYVLCEQPVMRYTVSYDSVILKVHGRFGFGKLEKN